MPPPHPQLRPPPVAFRRNPIPHSALPIPNSPRPHPSFRPRRDARHPTRNYGPRPSPFAGAQFHTPHSQFQIPRAPTRHSGESRKPRPPLLPSPTQPRAATNPIPEITQIKRITVQDQAATTIRGQWASATSGATRGLGATCCPWRFGGCVDSGFRRKDVRMGRGLRGFRLSPKRREDGEGVTWIPAFAEKT